MAERNVTPIHERSRVVRLDRASEMREVRPRWLWKERIPVGELTLVAGREGIGKSTFLAWLAARITLGELEGEYEGQPRPILYAATEDSWETTIRPRMRAAGANLEHVYRARITLVELASPVGVSKLVLPLDVHAVYEEAARIGAPVVMLDPVLSFLDDKVDTYKSPEIRPVLEAIRASGADHGVATVGLSHFNKTSGTDILTKIAGSRAFAEVARAAIGLAKLPVEDDDDPLPGPYVLSQVKNNLGRMDHPNLTYALQSVELTDSNDEAYEVARFRIVGESDLSADQALNHLPARKRNDDGRTAEWVTEMIAWVVGESRLVPTAEVVEHCQQIDPNRKAATVRKRLSILAKSGELDGSQYGHWRGPV